MIPILDNCYAHSLLGNPISEWERLSDHLLEVQQVARSFAERFGAADWGSIVGLCHDLGKGSAEFQRYITDATDAANAGEEAGSRQRVDHSTFGARFVAKKVPGICGQILASCIAGHHSGLPNESSSDDPSQRSTLRYRLDERNSIPAVAEPDFRFPNLGLQLRRASGDLLGFQLAFFTRMLFSTLIDADRTCTERFCDSLKAAERAAARPALEEISARFQLHIDRFRRGEQSLVNIQRQRVLQDCLSAAQAEPGFFSLQVPTGGGKTLSSMSFALRHAQLHGLERIIVAIPFTSIIEQTADVYRSALGALADRALVEHHTNLEPVRDTRANQFGAEDWNAPIIVTTNVQLLETLFAARTSACRKLHRVANSVIVLDEAQMLPVDLMEPTLTALRELVRNYRCSVVLCTATQPALELRDDFPIGIGQVRPIICDPRALFKTMKRVEVRHLGRLDDSELATRISSEPSVLCIVNTRRHAAELYDAVLAQSEPDTCFHLSTLMCGAHRRRTIRKVRDLIPQRNCRIISTQLIEAGVDIDLPVVYRAAAGFDSIAQAAGRCNREGRNPLGITYVFEAQTLPPAGLLREGAGIAAELFNHFPEMDSLSPEAIERYFQLLYWKRRESWDKRQIMSMVRLDRSRPDRAPFQFRDVQEQYRLIKDAQLPILVTYDERSQTFADNLLCGRVDFVPHRQLQPYLVSVPERCLWELERGGIIRVHDSGVSVLLRNEAYSTTKGLILESIGLDPSYWAV